MDVWIPLDFVEVDLCEEVDRPFKETCLVVELVAPLEVIEEVKHPKEIVSLAKFPMMLSPATILRESWGQELFEDEWNSSWIARSVVIKLSNV